MDCNTSRVGSSRCGWLWFGYCGWSAGLNEIAELTTICRFRLPFFLALNFRKRLACRASQYRPAISMYRQSMHDHCTNTHTKSSI